MLYYYYENYANVMATDALACGTRSSAAIIMTMMGINYLLHHVVDNRQKFK